MKFPENSCQYNFGLTSYVYMYMAFQHLFCIRNLFTHVRIYTYVGTSEDEHSSSAFPTQQVSILPQTVIKSKLNTNNWYNSLK